MTDLPRLLESLDREPEGVIEIPGETFDHPRAYVRRSQAALLAIRLAMLAAGKPTAKRVLDFACGHAAILRVLKAEFPDAEFAAADTDREAVDFCARHFGAIPVYSHADPAQVELPGTFDLIWVGSLFTHLDADLWTGFIGLLQRHLSDDGVLVFTTAGRRVAGLARAGEVGGLTEEAAQELLDSFDRTGFGYQDYPGHPGIGRAFATPAWVCALLEELGGTRIVTYAERGWNGRQDVVACVPEPAGEPLRAS